MTVPLRRFSPTRRRFRSSELEQRCYRCERVRPLEEFPVDRSKPSGHKSICRECDRAKARRYYAKKVA